MRLEEMTERFVFEIGMLGMDCLECQKYEWKWMQELLCEWVLQEELAGFK